MPRHPKFEEHRWLGDKRSFVVYDTDDAAQFAEIEQAPIDKIASFGPDELREARNRGYRPASSTEEREESIDA